MGFNSAFKGLMNECTVIVAKVVCFFRFLSNGYGTPIMTHKSVLDYRTRFQERIVYEWRELPVHKLL